MNSRLLYVIPARKGSKGVTDKNKKLLANKPLISYTIEAAIEAAPLGDICVSTDDHDIVDIASRLGLNVPFVRPEELAQDNSSSRDVLLHALDFYAEEKGALYDGVVMLQPTSPLRQAKQIKEAVSLFDGEIDAILSVFETKANPYFVLMEENESGYLEKSKQAFFQRRQDCPTVYELNGAIYVISSNSLRQSEITQMERIIKYEMDQASSVDIDTAADFEYAEFLLNKSRNQ